jgi:SAM-dependent methyltransferase
VSTLLKKYLRIVLRPMMPGWPDEGRRLVQGPPFKRMLARISFASSASSTVLNAGAGEGSFSQLLLAIPGVSRVVELDLGYRLRSPSAIDPRQRFVAASLTNIPLIDASCDLILCSEVLEHIEDDGAALDELCRVLAPGGWLLISVPTPPAVFDPAHVREGYTAKELSTMLDRRGLEVIETGSCMYAAFKLTMRLWRRFGRLPKAPIWTLAVADRMFPMGSPMDLLILARVAKADFRGRRAIHQ